MIARLACIFLLLLTNPVVTGAASLCCQVEESCCGGEESNCPAPPGGECSLATMGHVQATLTPLPELATGSLAIAAGPAPMIEHAMMPTFSSQCIGPPPRSAFPTPLRI